ncbi:MAG: hypothetical protein A3F10_04100 [Coxiella sp. RIFCSPHIGHO2_12_FULL_42_15]|nr:MAG: hypothetical protein A3F10_04100 [Coxiella sp. RIFCSPHIGHO2_12_FULL_42_15]
MLIFFSIATANAAPLTDKNHKLTTLQHSIATIKADLNHEQQLRAASEKKLKMAELSEATLLKKLTQTQHHFDHQQQDLKELNQKAKKSQQAIHQQYEYLKEQIRAAYMLGHPPLLKLLLDESDSSRISRMRMYYHYLAKNEAQTIQTLRHHIQQLQDYQFKTKQQAKILLALQNQQQQEHDTLETIKTKRQQLVQQINGRILTKKQRLDQLIANKQRLERTLLLLQPSKAMPTDSHFVNLKGKLPWPVKGPLANKFGTKIDQSELRWNGIVIQSAANQPVRAIAAGQVIFADWLPGYGLLLIINHGNGYMSLYGRNHNLEKRVGDSVQSGETIANVGNSGGYTQPGLYFEMRFNAKPLDPSQWCT